MTAGVRSRPQDVVRRLRSVGRLGSLAVSTAVSVAATPGRAVARGAGWVRGRPRHDLLVATPDLVVDRPDPVADRPGLVADDERALGDAETGVRRRWRRRGRTGADGPPAPPPPVARGRWRRTRRTRPDAPAAPRPPRLRPRTIALVAVALAAPVGAAGVGVLTNDRLALRDVTVSGTGLLAVDDVRAAAAVTPGTPLAVVDLDRVAESVEALPEVADADVARRWPSQLHITVTERTPVTAVPDGSGEFVLVDATGTPFRTVPAPPADVPLLDVAAPRSGDPATAAGLTVIQTLPPALLPQVERVEVRDPGAVVLALRDGGRVVWGGVERSESKAVVLQALLPRKAREYDVTAPEVAVTRG